jgi:protocatechuate 3,4-dioxygenase beta subunit
MATSFSRRSFLWGAGALLIPACARTSSGNLLAPTPAMPDDDGPTTPFPVDQSTCPATADQIEGPFYKPGAPSRATLITERDPGERLVLMGSVLSTRCKPIANATLDIWHADARGGYDNDGWGLRGTLKTDAQGRFVIRTLMPGRYLNGKRYRPSHLHVKVRAAQQELTTQLYFHGDPYIEGDPFVDLSLVMAHRKVDGIHRANFDFVV